MVDETDRAIRTAPAVGTVSPSCISVYAQGDLAVTICDRCKNTERPQERLFSLTFGLGLEKGGRDMSIQVGRYGVRNRSHQGAVSANDYRRRVEEDAAAEEVPEVPPEWRTRLSVPRYVVDVEPPEDVADGALKVAGVIILLAMAVGMGIVAWL